MALTLQILPQGRSWGARRPEACREASFRGGPGPQKQPLWGLCALWKVSEGDKGVSLVFPTPRGRLFYLCFSPPSEEQAG